VARSWKLIVFATYVGGERKKKKYRVKSENIRDGKGLSEGPRSGLEGGSARQDGIKTARRRKKKK